MSVGSQSSASVDDVIVDRRSRPNAAFMTQPIHRGARFYPNRPALIFKGKETSWAAFQDRIARLAAGFASLGIGEDDIVSILSMNSDRFFEAMYATWWAGGVYNGVNIRWAEEEIIYALNDCGSEYLIVDKTFAPLVPALLDRCEKLRIVIHFDEETASDPALWTEKLIARNDPTQDVKRSDQDLAVINYTGGTTGFPKGVMLSHIGLYTNAMNFLIEGFVPHEEFYLMNMPLFHVSGIGTTTGLIMGMGTAVIEPVFTPQNMARAIETYKIAHISLVPTMIQMMIDDPVIAKYDLSSVRQIGYGAAPISEGLMLKALEVFQGARFTQAYGATELSASGAFLPPRYHEGDGLNEGKLKSAGRATFTIDLKIVDKDHKEVPRGTVGEIAARGPGVMQRYLNKPEQTAASITEDGFYLTGDGAYMDEDGFIFIVDRMKDMIVTGAENVYSAEVENALSRHPAVAQCAVIGIPDEKWGEAVHGVIQLKPGGTANAEQLDSHCRTLIAGYKCPKAYDFIDEMPLSAAGKILKTDLRERYQ